MSEDQVLTIKDVAAILKLAEKTVYSIAQDGELPAFKVRGQWRIRKVEFEKWTADQAAGGAKDKGEEWAHRVSKTYQRELLCAP